MRSSNRNDNSEIPHMFSCAPRSVNSISATLWRSDMLTPNSVASGDNKRARESRAAPALVSELGARPLSKTRQSWPESNRISEAFDVRR